LRRRCFLNNSVLVGSHYDCSAPPWRACLIFSRPGASRQSGKRRPPGSACRTSENRESSLFDARRTAARRDEGLDRTEHRGRLLTGATTQFHEFEEHRALKKRTPKILSRALALGSPGRMPRRWQYRRCACAIYQRPAVDFTETGGRPCARQLAPVRWAPSSPHTAHALKITPPATDALETLTDDSWRRRTGTESAGLQLLARSLIQDGNRYRDHSRSHANGADAHPNSGDDETNPGMRRPQPSILFFFFSSPRQSATRLPLHRTPLRYFVRFR